MLACTSSLTTLKSSVCLAFLKAFAGREEDSAGGGEGDAGLLDLMRFTY